MLKSLEIQNYALIEKLLLQPTQGFNIITGETGAGKSIMLGAVGLLLGNRADARTLFNESQKCIVEGEFEVGTYENLKQVFESNDLDFESNCMVRREVQPNGKSRAFVNDSPVTLDLLKQITPLLIDIHSQHETQFLADEKFQLNLIDEMGGHSEILKKYQGVFKEITGLKQELLALQAELTRLQQESDFVAFQLEELRQAAVTVGEKVALEQELASLEHAEEIQAKLFEALQCLSDGEQAGLPLLKQAQLAVTKIAGFSPAFEELRSRIEANYIELKDVVAELNHATDKAQTSDAKRQAEVEERLGVLYKLEKKHQTDANQLPEILSGLEQKLFQVESADEKLDELHGKCAALENELTDIASQLSAARTATSAPIQTQITSLLAELSMPFAQFTIQFAPQKPNASGADAISFLFSANKGSDPKSLKMVASGGEFSRLMLAIKYVVAGKTALPTLIFDEIDTGVSGEVAAKMGRLMQGMSAKHQVLTITHTAQIAAMGSKHFFVEKAHSDERTTSKIKVLSGDERVQEIAQMLSGDRITEASIQHAKELLNV
jgi:DNA repair protein RecN (Recombination protein N)